jgi:hypothetical protein
MQPRHQATSRRRTNATACISLCKSHPFGGKSINMGRFNLLLTIAPKVTVTEIISHDEDDIGLALVRVDNRDNSCGKQKAKQQHGLHGLSCAMNERE